MPSFSVTAWVIGSLIGSGFAGFFAYRWGYRTGKHHRPLKPDVTVITLEKALMLDRALEVCERPTTGVGHDHDTSPHVGVWAWMGENGAFHIRSRHTGRESKGGNGEGAAEAIASFHESLLNEARSKEALLKSATRA